jgi:hypothetical protein
MRNHSKKATIGKMIIFGIIAGTAFTFAIMLLWNWLMPVIFGLSAITFWQALGLLVLTKILFGRGHQPNWHEKEKSKMHKEQFMQYFDKRAKIKDVLHKNEGSSEKE